MSVMICPCGLNIQGDPGDVRRAYQRHDCPYHDAEGPLSWPETVGLIAVLAFVSFICTHGWGMFK